MSWCKTMPRGVGIISTPGQAIFEKSLLDAFWDLCWTFVGCTNTWPPWPRSHGFSFESWPSRPRFRDPTIKSWPWRPRIVPSNKGPTKVQQRFKNESKSQAVLGSEHVQGQSPSSDRATAWTQPRLEPSTSAGHESDRGAVPSLLLSAGCWIRSG